MDKPYRPQNTMPFTEPAFYVDPRQLAFQTIEAAQSQAQAAQDKAGNEEPAVDNKD